MHLKFSLLAAIAFMVSATSAWSQASLFWDPNDDTGGGSGTWNLTNLNWDPTPTAGSGNVAWPNGAADVAKLAGGPGAGGTITLGGGLGGTAIQGGQLQVINDGYSLQSNHATNTFSFGEAVLSQALTLTTGSNVNINGSTYKFDLGDVSGAGKLTLSNLSGANTHTYVGLSGLANNGGGIELSTTAGAGKETGILGTSGSARVSGPVTNLSTGFNTILAATNGNRLEVASSVGVAGSGSVIQIGTSAFGGTVELNGGSMSAPVDVVGGTFLVTTNLASNDVTVRSGANLTLNNSGGDFDNLNNGGTITLNGGHLVINGKTESDAGTLTLTADSVIDFGGLGGVIRFDWVNTNGFQLDVWGWTPSAELYSMSNTPPAGFTLQDGIWQGPNIRFYGLNGVGDAVPNLRSGGWSTTGGINSGGVNLSNAYEIVPVPEPSAVLSSLLLVLAIGWRERGLFARRRSALA